MNQIKIKVDGERYGLATCCVHAGMRNSKHNGLNRPAQQSIVQSAIFDLGTSASAEAIFSGQQKGYSYTRFGNPTVAELARAIANLEGGTESLVTSSGNAAVLCAVTAAMIGRKGPLVTHHDIYGGSFELLHILSDIYHVPVMIVDATDESVWLEAVAQAGAVLLETPSNPLMKLIGIEKTVRAAHSNKAPVIVDNTVATPFNQRPFDFDVDWVVHSTSKYLNGHSDMVGGCVVSKKALLPQHRNIHKNLGGTVNALDAWLILRGLRTFNLRMERHNQNGRAVAEWLSSRTEVLRVYYPGFASQIQANIFEKQMRHGGSLLSFELATGGKGAVQFLDRLKLITHAVSLGGVESLATRPAKSSHRGMTAEARQRAGISEGLIRLSVGLESIEDLLSDLGQALA